MTHDMAMGIGAEQASVALAKGGCAARHGIFPVLAVCFCTASAHAQSGLERLANLDMLGRSLVEQACSSPFRVKRTPVTNRHDPSVQDEVRLTECAGFAAEVYISNASQPPKRLPLNLYVTAPHPKLSKGAQVGDAFTSVLAALGQPGEFKDGVPVYELLSDSGYDTLSFTVRRGTVTRMTWSWDA